MSHATTPTTPASSPRRGPRPHITLTMPPTNMMGGQPTPFTAGTMPPNPHDPAYAHYNNPFSNMMYQPGKAGEFMFNQFEGFKNFTMSYAKSGLSIGEKTALWIYEKFSKWSKKWFTHIFLFLMVFAFSVAGGVLFVAVEGEQCSFTSYEFLLSLYC